MKKTLLLILGSGVVLLTALVIIIKTPYFLNVLEDIAGRGIGASVEIGSISFETRNVLIVKGLVIKGGSGDGFNLTVPKLALTFRLRDLLRRHVGEILITGPDLSITAGKEKAPEAGEAITPLPFILDAVSLSDGRIYIHNEKDRLFQVSSVNLSLKRNPQTGRTTLSAHALLSDLNSEISADAIIDMETLSVKSAHVHVPKVDLETLSGVFFQGRGPGVRGQGSAHAGFRITFPDKNVPRVYGTLEADLKNGGFSSADETVIAEGMNVNVSGRFEFPASLDSIDFSVSSEASGFELLAGRFYGTFSDRAVHCLAEGRYTKADDTLTLFRSTLGLAGIGDLLMTGTVSAPGGAASVDADIRIPDLSGGEAFDFFIRETFREQYPFLSGMRITGQASVDLNIRGSFERFTARGDFRIAGMEIVDVNSGNSVTGVNISLPFDISFPEAGPVRAIDRFGTVQVGAIKWPPFQFSGFEAFAAVGGNALVFKEDIRIPLYGGSVTLKKVSYRDILSPGRSLRLAVDLDGIDLAQAGKALDMPGFSGSVKGTIPKASFTENRFLTEGEIILELFDGTIRVSGFSADNLFSPRASVRTDIALDGINLGTLTRTFEFGHISGIMKGELKDLVIVNGQAQRVKGYLETYRKKGVEQRISVEALKKISILGTGTSASVLDRGIYQFFREYRYEKIGFRADLRNDNLLLLGTGGGADSQYLVKGGLLPPKVDVITYNQNISFKELVSRLKRISQIDRKEGR